MHKPELFYPIKWNRGYDYFKFGKQLRYNKKVFTHHLWNKKTQYTPFQAASFFDQLASKHCPTVREMYGDKFGMSEILLVNL